MADMQSMIACARCGLRFALNAPGTRHRNHCPHCLWSVHLDQKHSGDRAARCGGRMEPIAVAVKSDGEWTLVHRCQNCGRLNVNRIAGDDNELALLSLAVRPLARPAFPIEHLGRPATPDARR